MIWRFAVTIAISWFGVVMPVLMFDAIKNLNWIFRLILPAWMVHGSFFILLILWIAIVLTLVRKIWTSKNRKITYSSTDQRLARPRPFPIKPRSIITPIARIKMPLKFDKPPKDADAQQ